MSHKKQNKKQNEITPVFHCQSVSIKLPEYLSQTSIDQIMLKHYLKAILLKRKRVYLNQTIPVMILGKEQVVYICELAKFKNTEEEENKNQGEIKINYNQVLTVINSTNVVIVFGKCEDKSKKSKDLIGAFYGDCSEYQHFKTVVLQNFKQREDLYRIGLSPIKGIIIGGATGTGKTTFVKKLQIDINNEGQKIHFHSISATQLLSRVVGGSQQYVRRIFKNLQESVKTIGCILVIEDMHLLFGEKQLSSHETTLATLFSEMQNFEQALMVIGTYNSERELSKVVYQSGRFEKQIILNLPNHHQRLKIINSMLKQIPLKNEICEEDIKQFNLRLNGFSIGEIKKIIRDAYVLKKEGVDKGVLMEILKEYRPNQIKQLIVEVPEVYWTGIGGYESVKHEIRKVTQFPLKHPEKFVLMNITPSKGVLLYGPPGCSKTMMAKAIATESKLNFIGIKGPQLFSKYVGESERAIRNIFRKARAYSPCIIFFDQIDALASQRSDQSDVTNRVLGQLLTEMDGVEGLKEVIIIAATNRPQILDQALTRPGRFDHLIYIGPPDLEARKQIFHICLHKTPLEGNLIDLCSAMANRTNNYTGAEITLICRQAALLALEINLQKPVVNEQILNSALLRVKNRLTEASILRYQNFSSKFKDISVPGPHSLGQSAENGVFNSIGFKSESRAFNWGGKNE